MWRYEFETRLDGIICCRISQLKSWWNRFVVRTSQTWTWPRPAAIWRADCIISPNCWLIWTYLTLGNNKMKIVRNVLSSFEAVSNDENCKRSIWLWNLTREAEKRNVRRRLYNAQAAPSLPPLPRDSFYASHTTALRGWIFWCLRFQHKHRGLSSVQQPLLNL